MHQISDQLWSFNTRDLMRASSCEHCTAISIARTLGVASVLEKIAPYKVDGEKTLAMKYGDKFEAALQDELVASMGAEFVQRPAVDGDIAQTIELMAAGTPVIYQGGLERILDQTRFYGKPDFLVRANYQLTFVDGKLTALPNPEFEGASGYTVWDAKYSSKTKPAYLLQVAVYIDVLEQIGCKAEGAKHGIVLGSRKTDFFEEIEIVPAMKMARRDLMVRIQQALEAREAGDLAGFEADAMAWHCPTKDGCNICEYPDLCKEDRLATDDLVQIAGITQAQIAKLRTTGITTMRGLAAAGDNQLPAKFVPESFAKLRRQAIERVRSLDSGLPTHIALTDPEIRYLPKRSKNDIFFDMEGFPYFIEGGGLEYLFGNWDWNDQFTEFWAHDRVQEKQAFIDFVTWAVKQMQDDPYAHIYHYASYENSALVRLSVRFGVMEAEVRWLQQNHKLVDLYEFVRNSIVVGEESYSIKKLERHYGFKRDSDVQNANASIDEYDLWRELELAANDQSAPAEEREAARKQADEVFAALREYNIDDVKSTRALYEWLESMQGASSMAGEPVEVDEEEPGSGRSTKSQQEFERLQERTAELFAKVADWQFGLDVEADQRALVWLALTHSILFYKREEVMFWTDLNIRTQADEATIEEDRKAAAIFNIFELERELKPKQDGTPRHMIRYSAEIGLGDLYEPSEGDEILVRYVDGTRFNKRDFGKITKVTGNQIEFTRDAPDGAEDLVPDVVFEYKLFNTSSKQRTLEDIATEIMTEWGDPRNEAPTSHPILDLLLRRAPRLVGGQPLPAANTADYLPAVIEATSKLDGSVLCIQGPPGSGKTYLASRTIAKLVAGGKRVGIVANSHSAVENVLEACMAAGMPKHQVLKANQTGDDSEKPWTSKKSKGPVVTARKKLIADGEGYVIADTSFGMCNAQFQEVRFDYLFIDEAAQFSLVDAIAASWIADNLVLLGDPQQLPQVVQAVHPGGVANSALGHYMGDHPTLPKEMGYFIEVTRRLHPDINRAISWLSYEGKLKAHSSTSDFFVAGYKTGITQIAVEHEGNVSRSDEEVAVVVDLVRQHLREISQDEILVVAPYNAQVDALKVALTDAGFDQVMVGTVDKFQGREGLVVIYSFAASSANDAPRGLEFLLDRNRLNVAISRAKAHCYLVHGTGLLRSRFKNVEELKCASRLAGILEFAG